MRQVQVTCDAILHDREIPKRFFLGHREIEIVELIDSWPSQDHHYYKVRSEDNCVYILRYDTVETVWELTMFERRDYESESLDQSFHHTFRGKV